MTDQENNQELSVRKLLENDLFEEFENDASIVFNYDLEKNKDKYQERRRIGLVADQIVILNTLEAKEKYYKHNYKLNPENFSITVNIDNKKITFNYDSSKFDADGKCKDLNSLVKVDPEDTKLSDEDKVMVFKKLTDVISETFLPLNIDAPTNNSAFKRATELFQAATDKILEDEEQKADITMNYLKTVNKAIIDYSSKEDLDLNKSISDVYNSTFLDTISTPIIFRFKKNPKEFITDFLDNEDVSCTEKIFGFLIKKECGFIEFLFKRELSEKELSDDEETPDEELSKKKVTQKKLSDDEEASEEEPTEKGSSEKEDRELLNDEQWGKLIAIVLSLVIPGGENLEPILEIAGAFVYNFVSKFVVPALPKIRTFCKSFAKNIKALFSRKNKTQIKINNYVSATTNLIKCAKNDKVRKNIIADVYDDLPDFIDSNKKSSKLSFVEGLENAGIMVEDTIKNDAILRSCAGGQNLKEVKSYIKTPEKAAAILTDLSCSRNVEEVHLDAIEKCGFNLSNVAKLAAENIDKREDIDPSQKKELIANLHEKLENHKNQKINDKSSTEKQIHKEKLRHNNNTDEDNRKKIMTEKEKQKKPNELGYEIKGKTDKGIEDLFK